MGWHMHKLMVTAHILFSAVLAVCSSTAYAVQNCGVVMIDSILAGPRHGSMMHVNNRACGPSGGWVCLDPDGQYLSTEKGKRMYAFILAQYMAKAPISLYVHEGTFVAACGNYPVVEDVRTP